MNKEQESEMGRRLIKTITGEVVTTKIRDEYFLESFRSRKMRFEEKSALEEFKTGDIFIVTGEIEGEDNVKDVFISQYSKNSGIYIFYNDHDFYIGQTSISFEKRFKKHVYEKKKTALFEHCNIAFFGRDKNMMGKDQLDYIEKEFIKLFSSARRGRVNSDRGNDSHISEDMKLLANHFIDEVQRSLFFSIRNPFLEKALVKTEKIGGIDLESLILSSYKNLTSLASMLSGLKEALLFDHNWSGGPIWNDYQWDGAFLSETPKETESPSFYLKIRDGDWIQMMEDDKDFREALIRQYEIRRYLKSKFEELNVNANFDKNVIKLWEDLTRCYKERILNVIVDEKLFQEIEIEDDSIIIKGLTESLVISINPYAVIAIGDSRYTKFSEAITSLRKLAKKTNYKATSK